VTRVHYIVLAGIALLGIGYVFMHRQELGLTGTHPVAANNSRDSIDPADSAAHPVNIVWQKVDRSAEGFRVEMPIDVKQIQIPAYNETGGTDQVNMIFSNPDAETTFSVAWADNPPVARVNSRSAERTLEMAQDGAVARTQTTLTNEAVNTTQGFPGKEFAARNSGGGVMSSRLVYAGTRLYMLNAAFPSAEARRDRDVSRFFNSFSVTSSSESGKGASTSPAQAN
jgi:hypothetical protein